MKHLNIKVFGKVQGVFYRHSAKEKAGLLGLAGFIQNTDDGSVYLEVEGEDGDINDFLTWCKTGPQLAQVEKIDVQENQPQNLSVFEIR